MTLARYLLFLFIGMLTSIVVFSIAFQLDFRMFVSDMFGQLTQGDSYSVASLIAPPNDESVVALEDVEGITVDSQITVLRNLANLVHVTGIVSDWQAYEQLELQCEGIFPNSEIKNDVQVFKNASIPSWMSTLEEMSGFAVLGKVRNANIGVANELVEMTGTVSSKKIREAVLAAVNGLTNGDHGVTVNAQISVEAIPPEFDLWMATSDTVLLQGALGSKAKDALVGVINEHLTDDRRLVEALEINDDILDPVWLGAVQKMIPDVLVNMKAKQLKVKDDSVVLKGATGSKKIADAFSVYLEKAFPKGLYEINNALQVIEGAGGGKVVNLNSDELVDSNGGLVEVLESSAIYFGSGRTRLGSGDQRKLRKLASRLNRYGSVKVEIVGHCDPSGDAESNAVLAQRRCHSARDFLREMGVDVDRMQINAMGSKGKSGGSSAEQRRVEFCLASNMLPSEPMPRSAFNTSVIPVSVSGTQEQRMERVEELLQTTQVFFDTAKSSIKSNHKREIHVLAQHLKALGKMPQITIRGLADPRGNADYNRSLSRRRCEAVFLELKSLGVDTSEIKLDERGATTADMDDVESLRHARRVEFVIQRIVEVAA